MDSSKAFFTALGLSGTGKTSFIVGMYNELATGKDGFHLNSEDFNASILEQRGNDLYHKMGTDRFPTGTNSTEKKTYTFSLGCNHNKILKFDWIDYAGGTLQQREQTFDVYTWLEESITKSTGIYVFVDGDLLCYEKREKRIEKLKEESARTISGYITKFCDAHNGNIPPIIFVITKMDKWADYYKSDNEPREEIKEAFNTVFCEDSKITAYILGVSLGKDIEKDGEVKPINIELPILIGTFYEFGSRYRAWRKALDQEKRTTAKNNRRLKNELSQKEKRLNSVWNKIPLFKIFFRNTEYRVESLRKEIAENNSTFEEKQANVKKSRELLDRIGKLLNERNKAFDFFENGTFKNFTYGREE